VRMCEAYYIEALEHSAHLNFGSWNGKNRSLWGDARVKETLDAIKRKRWQEIEKRYADGGPGR
jgi:hypothetical protein